MVFYYFAEVEMTLNSIVMLLQVIPVDQCGEMITEFCAVLTDVTPVGKYGGARIRL